MKAKIFNLPNSELRKSLLRGKTAHQKTCEETADLIQEGLRLVRAMESGDDWSLLVAANEIRNERIRMGAPRSSRLAIGHAMNTAKLIRQGALNCGLQGGAQ